MSHTKPTIPSFTATLDALLQVVAESPEYKGNRAYADTQGEPLDLVGWTLYKLGLPLKEAVSGHRAPLNPTKAGTPWAEVRFPLLWTRLFNHSANFFGMSHDLKEAEDYLVCALLSHISRQAEAFGHEDPWRYTLTRGLSSFSRFTHHAQSGFLIQCSHKDAAKLLAEVDRLLAGALSVVK